MSTTTITIKDETATGKILREISIALEKELCTVKEIIQARVEAEVKDYNKRVGSIFEGLVQPKDAERTLNGFKMKSKRMIDAEKQTYIAWEAFKNNAFFVLVDDTQAETLEQEVLVTDRTTVSFIKLTPLVGG